MAVVLEVHDLEKSFGGVVAANDINVVIDEDETIGIIGANGAGKTTFVNMVTGWLRPTSGTIKFMGKNVIGMQPRDVTKLGLCRSFQIPQVFLSGTVLQNMMIAYGLAEEHGFGLLAQLYSDARVQRVEEHMARFKIGDYRDVPTGELPQGVRKLVDIAMATVRQPRLLMLDEPTSGISVEEKFGLMDIIMAVLKQERTTVLFIEHDMEIVERYVSRVLAFYQGAIVCDAPTAEAMQNESVKEFVLGHNPIGNGNA